MEMERDQRKVEIDDSDSEEHANSAMSSLKQYLYSGFKRRYEHLPSIELIDIIHPNTTGIEAIEISPVPADLPPKGPIQKLPLKVGEMYYAAHFLTMGSWIRVRLAQINNPGSIVNGQAITTTKYWVSMEDEHHTGYPTKYRLVSGKEIAYSCISPVLLEVGTRIVAIFRETPSIGDTKKEGFYPGIIAEPCTFTNRYRYLIFFDDGYAQYVEHKYVHLIYESSNYVWEDMHIDSRPFIKKYLESYPEHPMVKLRKDQTVRTEYNGKLWLTSVMNIDCSLVQMFFELSSRIEWIYRGSTRLNPMFTEEELAASNRNNKSRIPRQFNETGPYVQYTREPSSTSPPPLVWFTPRAQETAANDQDGESPPHGEKNLTPLVVTTKRKVLPCSASSDNENQKAQYAVATVQPKVQLDNGYEETPKRRRKLYSLNDTSHFVVPTIDFEASESNSNLTETPNKNAQLRNTNVGKFAAPSLEPVNQNQVRTKNDSGQLETPINKIKQTRKKEYTKNQRCQRFKKLAEKKSQTPTWVGDLDLVLQSFETTFKQYMDSEPKKRKN